MKCLIICSFNDDVSEVLDTIDISDCYIICADGGLLAAEKSGVKPDLWVGDMDSLKSEVKISSDKLLYPSDKALTDSHIAVNEALKRGYKEIYLLGATGGRLDHEFANYCLLKHILKSDGMGTIINKNNRIIMTDKNIEIMAEGMKYISFFPFGESVEGFSVSDVKYELENHLLVDYDTFTTSNEFLKNKAAKVSLKKGYVIIISSKDIEGV